MLWVGEDLKHLVGRCVLGQLGGALAQQGLVQVWICHHHNLGAGGEGWRGGKWVGAGQLAQHVGVCGMKCGKACMWVYVWAVCMIRRHNHDGNVMGCRANYVCMQHC